MESRTHEPFSREMLADPYPAYRALREQGRVQRTAAGHWQVLGYEEVSALLTDRASARRRAGAAASVFRAREERARISYLGASIRCSRRTRRNTRVSGVS